ncbi:MAG: ABC transporter permease [Actinomycetota bacterium]|jgi:peptide/nickel transport system permease protein
MTATLSPPGDVDAPGPGGEVRQSRRDKRRSRANKPPRPPFPVIGWIGLAIVGVFAALALAAPYLSPYRTIELAGRPLEAPSGSHLLGTNGVGQDVATQLLSGARVSLFVALVAGGGTLLIGAILGMVAGWAGGTTDAVLMRIVDLVLVIPKVPLLIVVGTYAGPGLAMLSLIIALTAWPPTARVVRSQVLSLRRRAHVKAALGFGANSAQILRHHILPEVGLILVAGFVGAAGRAITFEAGLAFLGLGDPSRASWGAVLRDSLNFSGLFFTQAWKWWLVPPVVSISVLLLGVTFLGIGLEQRINPRLVRHQAGAAPRVRGAR